jgi:hypothetical protein
VPRELGANYYTMLTTDFAQCILVYCVRGRWFVSRTVQTFVCIDISVCDGSDFFYLICMYLEKKSVNIHIHTYHSRFIPEGGAET